MILENITVEVNVFVQYQKVIAATFLHRPNRFIAQVMIDGAEETVHVKNTGRCAELLVAGSRVYLAEAPEHSSRKTKYDLVAVEKRREGLPPLLINMDSQLPNHAAAEWLRKGTLFSTQAVIRQEKFYGDSRFDCYIEDGDRRAFLEVKGVTLEKDGIALFPDAPTERGVKHIRGLMECVKEGYEAYILFVIQMKGVTAFRPNDAMHPAFGAALQEAQAAGVKILAMDCEVAPDFMCIDQEVPVIPE